MPRATQILLLPLFLSALAWAVPGACSLPAAASQLPLRSIGPAGMSGRITSIAVAPGDRDTWYVGSASGGLWRTVNAGTTFEPLFDEQPVQSIGAVAVAPSNRDVIYVGTGEGNPRNSQSSGNGLYRSRDGGRSWTYLGLAESRNVHRIQVHPRDENTLWVGVLGDPFADSVTRGVFKSTDGGASWRRVLFSNSRSGVADLVMDPVNPNRLIAALWEFRRRPWDFVSGGDGSGLYLSSDGGETWRGLGESDGLPAKPWGRIGVAIAPSQRDRVYALVESSRNALYRSDDGGLGWSRINENTIGSRPFYFAELYVDPRNENRVYNLYSRLARSEDAGASFEVIEDWGRELHADYHAFWIDPNDGDFIIAGTDGGLYWTHDRGANWRFAENLPLGQFYHLVVDDALPYNVYGGLQDNGTWYGPSEVWHRGGLRNGYWRELAFNDGFDVVLDGEQDHLVYALWQGGMLVRVDRRTGERKTISPAVGPVPLRFNWNAAIAGDPFDAATIYIGSQFLHRSRNRGDSWEIVSPDLTSNDPDKQRQAASGGLSIDATGAENHTTITAIAPSPLAEGTIWAGTDDGRLHLTRDGGASWADLSARLPDAPAGSVIRQIVPSGYEPDAVVVVIDNHLRGDNSAYLYRSTDFGRRWVNLVAGADLPSHVLSFVQDPVEPRLLFAGTETGLYVSYDGGGAWTRWHRGLPAVAVADMAIQARERDLVLATFGRSIWILDDLQPWRELARDPSLRERSLYLFAPADARQVVIEQAPGQRLSPDHLYAGDNNARQAPITFWVGDTTRDAVAVSIERDGELLRRWDVKVQPGLNRTHWDLQLEGRAIYGPLMSPDLEQPLAPPGLYTVVLTAGDEVQRAALALHPDPRLPDHPEAAAANLAYRRALEDLQARSDAATARLTCIGEALVAANQDLPGQVREALQADIDELWAQLDYHDIQGTISDSPRLVQRLSRAFYYTHTPWAPLTPNDRELLDSLDAQASRFAADFERFLSLHWQPKAAQLPPSFRCDEASLSVSPGALR